MRFNMFPVCVLFLARSAFAVLQVDDYLPDNWPDTLKVQAGAIQYVKDSEDCGFGYVTNSDGKVLDVYDCTKFNAFFSINFRICATEAVLKAHFKETCQSVKVMDEFIPMEDDPRCVNPDEINVVQNDCSQFIMCWKGNSMDAKRCPVGTGYDTVMKRCEFLLGREQEICGQRTIPDNWVRVP